MKRNIALALGLMITQATSAFAVSDRFECEYKVWNRLNRIVGSAEWSQNVARVNMIQDWILADRVTMGESSNNFSFIADRKKFQYPSDSTTYMPIEMTPKGTLCAQR